MFDATISTTEIWTPQPDLNGNDHFWCMGKKSKGKVYKAAKKLGPKATTTQIAKEAGFSNRKICARYFGSKIDLFKQLGVKIKTPKQKLIEAAKVLPFTASSREISKKAGYKSHKIITLYFNSLADLKKAAGKYQCNMEELNNQTVEFSPQDISQGTKIPTEVNEAVAEEAGLHAGDGCLYAQNGQPKYIYTLVGSREENEFYDAYIKTLYKKLYNIAVIPKIVSNGHGYGILISSKAVFTYKNKILGFPIGRKIEDLEMPPQIIKGNTAIKAAFIRGLADTDFSLMFRKKHKKYHYYPVIACTLASNKIIYQVESVLKELGFKTKVKTRARQNFKKPDKKRIEYELRINGKKQLEKWMNIISFSNTKHQTKYAVWKRFGFCPPKTSIAERKLILQNKLDPFIFYEVKK